MLAELPAAAWFRRILVAGLMLGILVLTWMVLQPFLVPTIWAAILAYVCWPLHIQISRIIRRRQNLAALVTTLIVSVVIVVPLIWLIALFQGEATRAYREVQVFLAGRPELPSALRGLPGVGAWLQLHWAELIADPDLLRTTAQQWLSSSADQVTRLVGGVGRNVAKLFIALFAMFFFLRDGARFFSQMRAVLEGILGPRVRDYMKAIGETTKAVVYALVLAALAQGVAAGLGYWAVGVRAPILVGALTAIAALVPFGAPVVWGALSIWLLITGQVGQGVALIVWGIGVVSWVDNLVRPLVISNATSMPFLLVVFGVLGGVISFGLVGLFIGPVVLAVALAIWREWLEHRRQSLLQPSGLE